MKKVLMMLAFAGAASAASAQQATASQFAPTQDKYRVVTNTFGDNWFVSLGGGASILFGHDDNAGKLGDRLSPTLNVAVGKWFTPGLGLRVQYSGLQAKGFSYKKGGDYVVGSITDGGYYKQKFDYMNLHGDVLFNLNALFGGYNPQRVYELIPYLGAGFTHSYSSPGRQAFALNAGFINRFRISNALDINLELSAMAAENKFDGEVAGKHDLDMVASATVGVTYRFPKRGFDRSTPQLISEHELRNMRQAMNDMTAANLALQKQLADAQNQPKEEVAEQVAPAVVTEVEIAPRTIFFEIGSTVISPREALNLKYLADKMNQHPNMTYTVYGYADSATGTPALNQALSQKRAQAVVDVLEKQYNISANRLKVDAGGGVDKFGTPIYLNRVVLVEATN